MAKAKVANAMFAGFPKSRLLKQAARINKIHGDTTTAFKLDPKFKRIDLILPKIWLHKPSSGLRQFWKHNLPSLKFHNYDTEFHVLKVATESEEELKKCPIKVVAHTESGKEELICSDHSQSEVLSKFIQLTEASPVPEEELKELDIKTTWTTN